MLSKYSIYIKLKVKMKSINFKIFNSLYLLTSTFKLLNVFLYVPLNVNHNNNNNLHQYK